VIIIRRKRDETRPECGDWNAHKIDQIASRQELLNPENLLYIKNDDLKKAGEILDTE
jgi:hypothetical protein